MVAKKKASEKPSAEKPAVIFVKPWVYLQSAGDGSAYANFFNTEEEASTYAEPDDERLCDDIFQVTLVIDPKSGRICNVKKREKDDE